MKRINQILERLTRPTMKTAPLSILLLAASAGCSPAFAQTVFVQIDSPQLNGNVWSGANTVYPPPPLPQATVPMSTFPHKSSKDGKTYTSTVVGTNPFAATLSGTTINAVVVPVTIKIGSTVFDPTAPDDCDSVPAQTRFYYSPLANNVPNLTILGVNVGTTQFNNGFRRAEFWSAIGGGKGPAYQNTINFSFPYLGQSSPLGVGLNGTLGSATSSSGCTTTIGYLPAGTMKTLLEGMVIPTLQNWGVISPTTFAVFLFRNLAQIDAVDQNGNPTDFTLGYHSSIGNPTQTFAAANWYTVNFQGQMDASVASHEIAEWMDDPLGTNATPAWGKVGQVQVSALNPSGCVSQWETGDPLTGKLMPVIKVPADPFQFSYHMQELAYFGFFYNSPSDASGGATFSKTRAACSPAMDPLWDRRVPARHRAESPRFSTASLHPLALPLPNSLNRRQRGAPESPWAPCHHQRIFFFSLTSTPYKESSPLSPIP